MRVHAIETGRLLGNETFMRADGWPSGLLRPRVDVEFPVFAFVLEHPEGTILIDTGLGFDVDTPRWQRRFVPTVAGRAPLEAAMRTHGLDPDAVTRVVLTHLDWDHVGGVGAFAHAEVLVHRAEHEAATSRAQRIRYRPELWPTTFSPRVYDLADEPLGPFPQSLAITGRGDVRLVPLPGHSAGQVGVVADVGDASVLFCADHVLRQDWFAEDLAAGRTLGLGIFFPRAAHETSRRVLRLVEETGAILVPSHDSGAPARLRALSGSGVSRAARPPAHPLAKRLGQA